MSIYVFLNWLHNKRVNFLLIFKDSVCAGDSANWENEIREAMVECVKNGKYAVMINNIKAHAWLSSCAGRIIKLQNYGIMKIRLGDITGKPGQYNIKWEIVDKNIVFKNSG